jgi:hypothetical protein
MGNVPAPSQTGWWEKTKDVAGSAVTAGMGPVGILFPHGIPIGDIVEKQAAKAPDDPSRWFLNTVQDLGLVSAKTLQTLTTPENTALIGIMATGNPEAALPKLANLGFSLEMGRDAVRSVSAGVDAAKKGNLREAGRLFSSAGVNALLIALGSRKAAKPGATLHPEPVKVESARIEPVKVESERIETPKPPEQRMDAETRLAVRTLMELDPSITREEAIRAHQEAPNKPVPPPPDIIVHPKPIRSEGRAVTVTQDDVRAYVDASTGKTPMKVTGPDREAQDLADPTTSEARRVRDIKMPRKLHEELLPETPYRVGMTVGEAVDAAKEKISTPSPPAASEGTEEKPNQGPHPPAPGGGAPKPPQLQLAPEPVRPTKPTMEPGWKMSLASYPPAQAEKYRKAWGPNTEAIRLVPDPDKKGRYWVSYKPKEAVTPKALGPAPKIPFTPATGPKPAPYESHGAFVERRLKEVTGQMIGLMGEGKPVPAELEAEHSKLSEDFRSDNPIPENPKPPTGPISRQEPKLGAQGKGRPVQPISPADAPAPKQAAGTPTPEKSPAVKASSQFEGLLGPLQSSPVGDIHSDPKRFQFRTELSRVMRAAINGGDAKYKQAITDPVVVWRDPKDGNLYVIDGHHRLELAKRSGTKHIETRELKAPDAQFARAFGAMRNIASGHATSVDVAKFIRDTGVTPEGLEKQGISLGQKIVSEGSRLANLDDPIFDQVVSGRMPESTGAAIGTLADKTKQGALAQLIAREKGRNLSHGVVDSLARRATMAGDTEKHTLFGTETESNVLQASRLEDYTRNRLASDKRLFGYVAKGERPAELARAGNIVDVGASKEVAGAAKRTLDVFDKLIERAGPINDAINQGAAAIAAGESEGPVREQVYKMVHEAVKKELEEIK